MGHNFPPLADIPTKPTDLRIAYDLETHRPLVWDEMGMPLDSYFSEDRRPVRDSADYPADYVPDFTRSGEGYTVNASMMRYARDGYPELLHLIVDGARAYREIREIPGGILPVEHALNATLGLRSLWALLMYRRDNRVQNGELPVHVAHAHRFLAGAEDVLETVSESFAAFPEPVVLPADSLTEMGIGRTLTNDTVFEQCPAGARHVWEVMTALVVPAKVATAQLATLTECKAPRSLIDMQVDDLTFAAFAGGMRLLRDTHGQDELMAMQKLLHTT